MHACSSYELDQSVVEKSAAEAASLEYEVIPAFGEANNPTVQSNIAYGTIQLPGGNNPALVSDIQQQEHKSGSVSPGTQAHGINKEEESAYDDI